MLTVINRQGSAARSVMLACPLDPQIATYQRRRAFPSLIFVQADPNKHKLMAQFQAWRMTLAGRRNASCWRKIFRLGIRLAAF